MTTTNAINGQSIGTSTNVGEGKFPQKVTLAATTTAFIVTLRLTNGADTYMQKNEIVVWYSTSSFSITAAAAVAALRPTARYISIKPPQGAGVVAIKDSSLEPVTGGFLYLWCDLPTFLTAATLDVNTVELP